MRGFVVQQPPTQKFQLNVIPVITNISLQRKPQNMLEAGIPVKCETCHNINGWKPSAFNHTTTGYELKGGHKLIVQCSSCHKGNVTIARKCVLVAIRHSTMLLLDTSKVDFRPIVPNAIPRIIGCQAALIIVQPISR